MTSDEAKKYCIEVIGMSESDFRKPDSEDLHLDGVTQDSWIYSYGTETECGIEYDSSTAIEAAKEHKFLSNPENVDAYIDYMLEQNAN